MTDYVKSTNFTSKDSLPSGNALKIIKGTEFDVEFNNIATAITTKADLVSPTFTGTPLAPTAGVGTSTTQVATTAFVTAAITNSDYLNIPRIDVASASNVNLTTSAPNTRHINITGTTTITDFTIAAGNTYFVRFDNSLILTNGSSLITQFGRNIVTVAGDTCIIRATAANTVEILAYSPIIPDKQIQSITSSVASNALTVTLNPTRLDFRSSTLSSGVINTRYNQSAISLVIPSGATLGTTNAAASTLTLLALDNAGTIELAVINTNNAVLLNEAGLISTTLLDSSSDSAAVVYSATARTNVSFRVIGYVTSTQATAGTWASAPSSIIGGSSNIYSALSSSIGIGQTWQNVTASRATATTYTNSTGRPISLSIRVQQTSSNASFELTVSGDVVARTSMTNSIGYEPCLTAIVPSGSTYRIDLINFTLNAWWELR